MRLDPQHFEIRERVIIHKDCGSCLIIPILDLESVVRMYQQDDEQTAGSPVYVCKDETNNALLQETPRQNSNRLLTGAMRRCAHNNSVATEQRHKKREQTKQLV